MDGPRMEQSVVVERSMGVGYCRVRIRLEALAPAGVLINVPLVPAMNAVEDVLEGRGHLTQEMMAKVAEGAQTPEPALRPPRPDPPDKVISRRAKRQTRRA